MSRRRVDASVTRIATTSRTFPSAGTENKTRGHPGYRMSRAVVPDQIASAEGGTKFSTAHLFLINVLDIHFVGRVTTLTRLLAESITYPCLTMVHR